MKRFDKFNSEVNGATTEPREPIPTVENGAASTSATPDQKRSPGSESALSELEDSAPPPKKKAKKSKTAEDDDAAFARKLQAEENARTGRATRGANTRKKAPLPKKKTKKKSSNRVKDEDDSDIASGSEKEKTSPSRKGGFHVRFSLSLSLSLSHTHTTCTRAPQPPIANHAPQKPMALSPALSALLNETQLSRPQTVKKIWEYVKARDLQDPSDKRQIRCDDAMRAVFKSDRVHMFTMNKILNQNLYAVDDITTAPPEVQSGSE